MKTFSSVLAYRKRIFTSSYFYSFTWIAALCIREHRENTKGWKA